MKKLMNKQKIMLITLTIMLIILLSTTIYAVNPLPEGPGVIDIIESSRRTPHEVRNISVIAGNVTQLNITGTTVTQSWAGVYGRVSGIITLDNAAGDTMFDWDLADPRGEVYATSMPTVNWETGNIWCWNWSDTLGGPGTFISIRGLEGWGTNPIPESLVTLGMEEHDPDGINKTFDPAGQGEHPDFFVCGQRIYNNTCPTATLYNSTGDGAFKQVLLFHDGESVNDLGIIYTSILVRGGRVGFDGEIWDFQMLLGEDGRDGNIETSTYYFYVQLE